MDNLSDLAFFSTLMKLGTLAATAQELGVTPPAVSKRLAALEQRLGVRLLNRTTRRISLTPEGETYLVQGAKVLQDLEALERTVAGSRATPKGLLRVSATLGFGRRHIAPALSRFARAHGEIEVQLHLSDRPVNLVEQGLRSAGALWRAPRCAAGRPACWPATPACCAPRRPTLRRAGGAGHAARAGAAPLHLHPRKRRDLWHLAPAKRRPARDREGARPAQHQRRRIRAGLGAGRPRHPDALAVGGGALPALGPPARGAAGLASASGGRVHGGSPPAGNLSAKTRALVDFLLQTFVQHRVGDAGVVGVAGSW